MLGCIPRSSNDPTFVHTQSTYDPRPFFHGRDCHVIGRDGVVVGVGGGLVETCDERSESDDVVVRLSWRVKGGGGEGGWEMRRLV